MKIKPGPKKLLTNNKIETTELFIKGLIQGIGFRPFIYRLAKQFNLNGTVYNQNNGVVVHLQGEAKSINGFYESIKADAPRAACIESIDRTVLSKQLYPDFRITESEKVSNSITWVSPDIAVCDKCMQDTVLQEHRVDYPFVNCTNCGPRFSIVENIPYDRVLTSMKEFDMCAVCKQEYNDVNNRRFHAQPIACNNCGPEYTLQLAHKTISDFPAILKLLSDIITKGGVVAMKGLGGYHLCCDASNELAVKKLRLIKQRDGKPFAIMFRSVDALKKYANIGTEEEQLLTSWQRPIVLIESKKKVPEEIARGLKNIGAFLPYMPFHYQVFEILSTDALIMTSGNISDCPIIIDNSAITNSFNNGLDAVVSHNRDIVNRVDDSVVQKVGKQCQVIRRSRGYAPVPINLKYNIEGILATGAELANTFCIGKGKYAILSQHIGDIKNLETMEFFESSYKAYRRLFEFEPKHAVCDLHPEYLSAKFAEETGLPVLKVQHHHAHIASCMAEYNLDEPVIGICYDGTGYGTDGKIWGSEAMVADLTGFERKHHFEYVPVPGGDMATKEPWRSAVAYLMHSYGNNIPELPFLASLDQSKLKLVKTAIEKNINCPDSCSAGRLFDAISALINVCIESTYHAEAPILLENSCGKNVDKYYSIKLNNQISWKEVVWGVVNDLNNRVSVEEISAKFHNTLIKITFEIIKDINRETGINKAVLAGGVFQNKYISEKLLDLLSETGIKAYMSINVPPNDGGISLGQIAIAAKKLALCV